MSESEYQTIDFSMLPAVEKSKSPLWYAFVATGVTFGMFLVIASIALATNAENRQMAMAIAGGLGLVALISFMVRAFLKLFNKLSVQKQFMRKFADANGWQYDGTRSDDLDTAVFPPSRMPTQPTWRRFRIAGKLNTSNFEYYQLVAFVRRQIGGWTIDRRKRFPVYVTILRLEGQVPIINKYPDLGYEQSSQYTYIILWGNAFSAEDVKHIFMSVSE